MKEATKAQIEALWATYNHSMKMGQAAEREAIRTRMEAEQAAEDYRSMKIENRVRRGHSGNPSTGQANDDTRFAGFTVAQAALKDNQWYMAQAAMYSSEAGMHYQKAASVMACIQYQLATP
jgi:hypothetical protein